MTGLAIERLALDVGQPNLFTLKVTGGLGPYATDWGGLPAGCTPANAVSLPCTPTEPGEYTVHVNVTDANGITVGSPWVQFWVHPWIALAHLSAAPAPATVGEPWTFTVSATEGTPPYRYSYGGLPTGCGSENLSVLRCVPVAAGVAHPSVTVVDAAGATVTGQVSVVIAVPPTTGGLGPLAGPVIGMPWVLWVVLGVAAVAGGAVVARRRPSRPEG